MSVQPDRNTLPPARRRRIVGLGFLRSLATTVVLVALYYLLPLDHIKNVPVTLAAGLLILVAVIIWQLRVISRARYPADNLLAVALPSRVFRDDAALAQWANQALAANAAVPGGVKVTVRKSSAFLTGTVSRNAQRVAAKTPWSAWPG